MDIQALRELGLSDEEIAQLASMESGGFAFNSAPNPVTNTVAGAYDYVPQYGGGDIAPGTTANIFSRLGLENPNIPVFELLGSENKGGTNANERMTFAAAPGNSYRLVNNATGEVVGEAGTPEAISSLVAKSNALSKQLGKKADLSFEKMNEVTGNYSPIFRDEKNILMDTPMKLLAAGMLAATGAGLLQPGGLGGAAGASGAGGAAGASNAAISGSVANTINAAAAGAQAGTAASLAPVYGGALSGTGGLLGAAGAAIPQGASLAPQALSSLPSNLSAIQATTAGAAGGAGGIGGVLKGVASKVGVSDYLTAASLLGSAVSGGGGGRTTAMPYTSPFGAGVGLGTGQDMRVNPNIADYERYGFGPEATFFQPGYSQLVSGGAPLRQTTMGPPASMLNPQYVPLI
jgi:hypothetical protein